MGPRFRARTWLADYKEGMRIRDRKVVAVAVASALTFAAGTSCSSTAPPGASSNGVAGPSGSEPPATTPATSRARQLTQVAKLDLPSSPDLFAITEAAVAVVDGRGELRAWPFRDGAEPIVASQVFATRRADLCGKLLLGTPLDLSAALVAIDVSTGEQAWTVPTSSGADDAEWRPLCGGARSEIPLAYEVTQNRGVVLHGLDPATGNERWHVDFRSRDDTKTSDSMVIVDGVPPKSGIAAYGLDGGAEAWRIDENKEVVLAGSAAVLVESSSGGRTTREVIDAATGNVAFTLPDDAGDVGIDSALGGRDGSFVLVSERGRVFTKDGSRKLADIRALLEGIGALPDDLRPVGLGPGGTIWVSAGRTLLLADLVGGIVLVRASNLDDRALGAIGDVAVGEDGTVWRLTP